MSPHDEALDSIDEQGRGLRRLAHALVPDPGAADDAVQEAWLLALRRKKLGAVAWMRGVVKNKVRERRRSDARRHAREQHAPHAAPAGAPTDVSASIDLQQRVMAALGRVPEPFRTAVWMRHIAGHDTQAVAEALGIPPATVRTRVHRGLEHVREQLDAEHGGDRKRWQALLAPLLWESPPTPVAPAAPTSPGPAGLALGALALGAIVVGVALLGREGGEAPDGDARPVLEAPAEPGPRLEGRPGAGTEPAAAGATNAEELLLRGTVRPAGVALPDAVQVYVIHKQAQFHTRPAARGETDMDGRFELHVRTVAEHWIAAISADGKAYGAVDGDAWSRERPLVIPLAPPPERTIRVFDRAGVLVPNLLVWFLPVTDDPRRAWPRPGDDRFTTFTEATDERGVARVRVATDATFRIRIRDRLPVTDRLVLPGASDVDVHLSPGGTVRLTLADWTREQPAFEGHLENVEDAGAARPSGTFRSGVLVFPNVPRGRWRIHARSPTWRTTADEVVHVTEPEQVVRATAQVRRRTDIGSLVIELYDPEGQPLPAGRFWNSGTWLRPRAAGRTEWMPRQPDEVDDNRLELRGVPIGTHDLFMTKWVGGRLLGIARPEVQIAAGQTSRVRLDLRPAFRRVLPDLGPFVVAHRRLVHAELGELPILSEWTRRAHPVGGLPLEGSELGPYPEGEITLELWDPQGRRKAVPLGALRTQDGR